MDVEGEVDFDLGAGASAEVVGSLASGARLFENWTLRVLEAGSHVLVEGAVDLALGCRTLDSTRSHARCPEDFLSVPLELVLLDRFGFLVHWVTCELVVGGCCGGGVVPGSVFLAGPGLRDRLSEEVHGRKVQPLESSQGPAQSA